MRTLDQMLRSRTRGERIFAILFSRRRPARRHRNLRSNGLLRRPTNPRNWSAHGPRASAPNVARLALRQVLILVAARILLGLSGAYSLTRFVVKLPLERQPHRASTTRGTISKLTHYQLFVT